MTILSPLLQLKPIDLNKLHQDGSLAFEYPSIAKMKDCPQNKKWHAEGDVLIHTQMVLEEGFKILDRFDSFEDKVALLLGCLLHDIGKPLVTNRNTLSAAGHEGAGVSLAGEILHQLGVSFRVKSLVLEMVKDHGVPRALVKSKAKDRSYRKLGLRSSCRMLYYLELADFLGREGESKEESLAQLELFREKTQQLGVFEDNVPLEIQQFRSLVESLGLSSLKNNWLVHQHIKSWLNGKLPETTNNPSFQKLIQMKNPPWLLYTMGISGSGKTTWAEKQNQEMFFHLSTDKTRAEINGSETILDNDGKVFELCYSRLRDTLKSKKSVLWDATCISYKSRERLLDQARSYSPLVGLVRFPINFSESFSQNQNRSRQVPESVLRRQAGQYTTPKFHEYEFSIEINKENRDEPIRLPEF